MSTKNPVYVVFCNLIVLLWCISGYGQSKPPTHSTRHPKKVNIYVTNATFGNTKIILRILSLYLIEVKVIKDSISYKIRFTDRSGVVASSMRVDPPLILANDNKNYEILQYGNDRWIFGLRDWDFRVSICGIYLKNNKLHLFSPFREVGGGMDYAFADTTKRLLYIHSGKKFTDQAILYVTAVKYTVGKYTFKYEKEVNLFENRDVNILYDTFETADEYLHFYHYAIKQLNKKRRHRAH